MKEMRDQDIAQALQKHNEEVYLQGEKLPKQQQVYQVKVVTTFLHAGTPLSKLDIFRDRLEENVIVSLTSGICLTLYLLYQNKRKSVC